MTTVIKQKIQNDENNLPYHYIDVISEESRLIWEIERRSLIEFLKKNLMPYIGQDILDAGCGDGRFCFELTKDKANVTITGLDASKNGISFARVFNPECRFLITDLSKPPENLGQFDQIICQEVLEHLPLNKINLVLKNLNSLLKAGGKIIFTVPSKKLRVPLKHFQHFDKQSLGKILDKYFLVEKILGHNIVGTRRIFFLAVRYFGLILFPFRNRYKVIYKLYKYTKNFYEENLVIGDVDRGLGLVAICRKKI